LRGLPAPEVGVAAPSRKPRVLPWGRSLRHAVAITVTGPSYLLRQGKKEGLEIPVIKEQNLILK